MYQSTNQRDFARKLRKEMTDAERKLWSLLRCKQFGGFKFRRQAAIDRYIVDFVCFKLKLIIEVDGGQHNDERQEKYDAERTQLLESQGFRVLRFWNFEVLEDSDALLDAIERTTGELDPSSSPLP